jgi:SAM-dependent methyltransferase
VPTRVVASLSDSIFVIDSPFGFGNSGFYHRVSHEAHNRRAWDRLVAERERHTTPARDADFADSFAAINADGWLGQSIAGKRVLCLAAGGGRQSALYAAAGATVTVVDLSPAMLALDRQVASERRLDIRAIEASMEDLSMLSAAEFDIVVQPVSTCYVPNIRKVYEQVARVAAGGALYISQHKQPAGLQAEARPAQRGYELIERYYRTGPLPPVAGSQHREPGTLEYLHRWEELLGGLCQAGFVIEDLLEPLHARPDAEHGTFGHRSQYLPPYVRIKARRLKSAHTSGHAERLWVP